MIPCGMTVCSNLEPAVGAIALAVMLYLAPSLARVLLSPTSPSLAVNVKLSDECT